MTSSSFPPVSPVGLFTLSSVSSRRGASESYNRAKLLFTIGKVSVFLKSYNLTATARGLVDMQLDVLINECVFLTVHSSHRNIKAAHSLCVKQLDTCKFLLYNSFITSERGQDT